MPIDLESELARWRRVTGLAEPPPSLLATLEQLALRPVPLSAEMVSLGRPALWAAAAVAAVALVVAVREVRAFSDVALSTSLSDPQRAG